VIVSFYSFKGGVGRTMALVNIGVELSRIGKSVLLVDFDLEAPGLTTYMRDLSPDPLTDRRGMIDWLTAVTRPANEVNWHDFVSTVSIASGTQLDVFTSGQWDSDYNSRVLDFDWVKFFESGGGDILETLRSQWLDEYDFVLIDSRTGITETAGVCTVHLPDVIVPVFTANQQSVDGVQDIILRAQKSRMQLANPRGRALVLPLPSRFDDRTESELSREWMEVFAERLGHFYDDWLPNSITPRQALERTKLPYVSYYSFGDNLAVTRDSPSDVTSLGFAFRTAARLIEGNFRNADALLGLTAAPFDSEDPILRFSALLQDSDRITESLVPAMARVLHYSAQSAGPPGPPSESIDRGALKLLMGAGLVERVGDRVIAVSGDDWLRRPDTPVDEYRHSHADVLAWSYRVVEAVSDELNFLLAGSDLADGIAFARDPSAGLSKYEHELVESSRDWASGRDAAKPSFTDLLLRSYALVGLGILFGGLIGFVIGSIAQDSLMSAASTAVGAAIGAVVGLVGVMWTVQARASTRRIEDAIPLAATSSGATSSGALRTAALALQKYGYAARRSGSVVVMAVNTPDGIPRRVRGLPLAAPRITPGSLTVHLRLAEDDLLEIEGPRFAVARVARALRDSHY
jgi:cellulose biosynthesis protein BcsQ